MNYHIEHFTNTVADINLRVDELYELVGHMGFERAVELVAKKKIFDNLEEHYSDYFDTKHLPEVIDTVYDINCNSILTLAVEAFRKEYN